MGCPCPYFSTAACQCACLHACLCVCVCVTCVMCSSNILTRKFSSMRACACVCMCVTPDSLRLQVNPIHDRSSTIMYTRSSTFVTSKINDAWFARALLLDVAVQSHRTLVSCADSARTHTHALQQTDCNETCFYENLRKYGRILCSHGTFSHNFHLFLNSPYLSLLRFVTQPIIKESKHLTHASARIIRPAYNTICHTTSRSCLLQMHCKRVSGTRRTPRNAP